MRPLIVIGTRPEAIKLAPVARALPEAAILLTGQHPTEMVVPTLEYFGVADQIAVKCNHIAGLDLPQSFSRAFSWIGSQLADASCVIGQGDTTTAAAAAQAAFYAGVPFVHVEAGLRTYDATPYPEEFFRRLCALAATVHCCPTERAAANLRNERVVGLVEVTGNTVVDAIEFAIDRPSPEWPEKYAHLDSGMLILVTCHRRENHGFFIDSLSDSIAEVARCHDRSTILWAAHPNLASRPSRSIADIFIAPPPYAEWVWLMNKADLIVTDSGGIQEEAAILGKPCYVLRDSTERPEALECGACRMTDFDTIEGQLKEFLGDREEIPKDDPFHWLPRGRETPWPIRPHPFGDGHAGEKIAKIVRQLTNTETEGQINVETVSGATH